MDNNKNIDNGWVNDIKKHMAFYTVLVSLIIAIITFLNKKYSVMPKKNKILETNTMISIENKMNSFNYKPQYFYLDTNIIFLMDSIKDFEEENQQIFNSLLEKIDQFLYFTLIKKGQFLYYLYQNMLDMRITILNNINEFVYTNIEEERIQEATESLDHILLQYIHDFANIVNKDYTENGPNRNNKYIYINDQVYGFKIDELPFLTRELY